MNGKGMSMENVHVNLTPFTSVPATSKSGLKPLKNVTKVCDIV